MSRLLLLEALNKRGSLTDDELYDVVKAHGYTKSPDRLRHLRKEVVDAGYVTRSGTRTSQYGRKSTHWEITEAGREMLGFTGGSTPEALSEEIGAIDRRLSSFVERMRHRLHEQARSGYRGWDDPTMSDFWKQRLDYNIQNPSQGSGYVDIANLAMFCFNLEDAKK